MKTQSIFLILTIFLLSVPHKAVAQFNSIEENIIEADFEQALSLLEKKSMFGDTYETYLYRGIIFARTVKTEEAFKQWDNALEARPGGKYHVYLAKSQAYNMLGDSSKANEYLRLAKETLKPGKDLKDNDIVFMYLMYGKLDEALKLYEKIIKEHPTPGHYNEIAAVLQIAGRSEESFYAYRKSFQLDHSETSIFKDDEFIRSFFINAEKYDQLNTTYKERSRKRKNKSKFYYQWANALASFDLLEGNDPEKLKDDIFYDQLELYPFHDEKIMNSMRSWLKSRNDEIIALYEQAITLKPKKAAYHHALGKMLGTTAVREDEDKAMEAYVKANTLAPRNKDYLRDWILFMFEKRYFIQAEEKLNTLRKKFPKEKTWADSLLVDVTQAREEMTEDYFKMKKVVYENPYDDLEHMSYYLSLSRLRNNDKAFFRKEMEGYKQLLREIRDSDEFKTRTSLLNIIGEIIEELLTEPEDSLTLMLF